MITLVTPISVTPPPIGDKPFPPIELKEIDYSVSYDNTAARCTVFIKGVNRNMLIWEGPDYVAAGQWTDPQIDDRVKALLGSDMVQTLQNLFINVVPYSYTPPAP